MLPKQISPVSVVIPVRGIWAEADASVLFVASLFLKKEHTVFNTGFIWNCSFFPVPSWSWNSVVIERSLTDPLLQELCQNRWCSGLHGSLRVPPGAKIQTLKWGVSSVMSLGDSTTNAPSLHVLHLKEAQFTTELQRFCMRSDGLEHQAAVSTQQISCKISRTLASRFKYTMWTHLHHHERMALFNLLLEFI